MHLIVIHKDADSSARRGFDLLQVAISCRAVADIIFAGLTESCCFQDDKQTIIALPEGWRVESSYRHARITYYSNEVPDYLKFARELKTNERFILSNGRYVSVLDRRRLRGLLSDVDADVIAVRVDPALLSYHERVRITTDGRAAGFRRFYSDSVLPSPIFIQWPHYIFFRHNALDNISADDVLPASFAEFLSWCTSKSLRWRSLCVGGTVLDLGTAGGLLNLINTKGYSIHHHLGGNNQGYGRVSLAEGCAVSADARLFGTVVAGRSLHIGEDAIVVGPTILGDDVTIGRGAVVRSSIIGPGVSLNPDDLLQNRVVVRSMSQPHKLLSSDLNRTDVRQLNRLISPFVENGAREGNFRVWPGFSYARFFKRVADIIASLMVLVLFAPVFPIIALAIKLNLPGPVFFRHKRQMRHGKEFLCLKFRTMIIGADTIQEQLRFKNQVDGPQFKVENDPRVTVVGRFLRDTFIDEIPQFINILLGQMSVVGPRPSPESENSICPSWRDARLSVRPGITGLWQVCRTRRPGRDFQEWIYYDTKYVRNLSVHLDLWICWRTAKKLIANFIERF